MEELILKLLAIVERFGAPGAVVFFALWQLEKRDHKETRNALAVSQEKRIEQALTVTTVVESCRDQLAFVLEALKGTQETYKKLLARSGRGGRDAGSD